MKKNNNVDTSIKELSKDNQLFYEGLVSMGEQINWSHLIREQVNKFILELNNKTIEDIWSNLARKRLILGLYIFKKRVEFREAFTFKDLIKIWEDNYYIKLFCGVRDSNIEFPLDNHDYYQILFDEFDKNESFINSFFAAIDEMCFKVDDSRIVYSFPRRESMHTHQKRAMINKLSNLSVQEFDEYFEASF